MSKTQPLRVAHTIKNKNFLLIRPYCKTTKNWFINKGRVVFTKNGFALYIIYKSTFTIYLDFRNFTLKWTS